MPVFTRAHTSVLQVVLPLGQSHPCSCCLPAFRDFLISPSIDCACLFSLFHSMSASLTHSLTNSITHSLTHSLTPFYVPFTPSLPLSHIPPLRLSLSFEHGLSHRASAERAGVVVVDCRHQFSRLPFSIYSWHYVPLSDPKGPSGGGIKHAFT